MSIKALGNSRIYKYQFSICTFATDMQEYQQMVQSFAEAGFGDADCEYIYADNTVTNTIDAFSGINRFLQEAEGRYIIICHQDILINVDNRKKLEQCIIEIDNIDPKWAVLSNAGGVNFKYSSHHLKQPNEERREKQLPIKVTTVDENFILVNSSSNLAVSSDLKGYHMYGTDICIIADILGFNSYVIDFLLTHKSYGNADLDFYQSKKLLIEKYNHALRSRFLLTTITRLYISGSKISRLLLSTTFVFFLVRQYDKFFKPKSDYTPFKR